jgi:hypothetical protein
MCSRFKQYDLVRGEGMINYKAVVARYNENLCGIEGREHKSGVGLLVEEPVRSGEAVIMCGGEGGCSIVYDNDTKTGDGDDHMLIKYHGMIDE